MRKTHKKNIRIATLLKGQMKYDTRVIYCPYIPITKLKALVIEDGCNQTSTEQLDFKIL